MKFDLVAERIFRNERHPEILVPIPSEQGINPIKKDPSPIAPPQVVLVYKFLQEIPIYELYEFERQRSGARNREYCYVFSGCRVLGR